MEGSTQSAGSSLHKELEQSLLASTSPRPSWIHQSDGSCTCPLTLIVYAVSPNIWIAIPALFLTGLLYFAALSSFSNIAQLRAPSEFRGRVLSINQVVLGSVYAIALGIQGPLGDVFGVRTVTVAAALISLAGLAVVRFRHPGATHAVTSRP